MGNGMKYHRPDSVAEAVALLRRGVQPLAGGTALLAGERPALDAVADLQALGLDDIRRDGENWAAGAMTRLQDLVVAPALQDPPLDILSRLARLALPRPLRDMATIGGAVASGGAGRQEFLAGLLALDSVVKLSDGETDTEIALADLDGLQGQLIVEIGGPVSGGRSAGHARVARTPADEAIVAAVAVLDAEGGARLALSGLAPSPILLAFACVDSDLANVLQKVEERVAGLEIGDDFRAGSAYRRRVAPVAARRAIREAQSGQGGGNS